MIRCIRWTSFLATIAMVGVLVALPACTTGAKKNDADKTKHNDKHAHDDKGKHKHPEAGPRGGPLADWDDKYHGELIVEHGSKTAFLYLLDEHADESPDVEPGRFTKMKLTITSEKPPITVELTHDAKRSGKEGIAFVGTHDFFAKEAEFEVNVSGLLDEKKKEPVPYNDTIKYNPKKVAAAKKKSAGVRELYLKPGGIYTAADIQTNGTVPASEKYAAKYKGKIWEHADDVKPGDKVCPVTKAKAESECAWVVQGQRYEFCCPPCVDKFVRWAHNEPEKVKDAKEYVFKRM